MKKGGKQSHQHDVALFVTQESHFYPLKSYTTQKTGINHYLNQLPFDVIILGKWLKLNSVRSKNGVVVNHFRSKLDQFT
jgi:hypothetical protein